MIKSWRLYEICITLSLLQFIAICESFLKIVNRLRCSTNSTKHNIVSRVIKSSINSVAAGYKMLFEIFK